MEIKDKELDENILKIESQTKEIESIFKQLDESMVKELEVKIHDVEKVNQELESQHKIDEGTIKTLQNDLVF